jgi:hypothetical protein
MVRACRSDRGTSVALVWQHRARANRPIDGRVYPILRVDVESLPM